MQVIIATAKAKIGINIGFKRGVLREILYSFFIGITKLGRGE